MEANNISVVQLADVKIPDFTEKPGQKHISFGEDDKFPDDVIELFNKSPKHGAIVQGKADFIFGGGLKHDENDPKAVEFVTKYSELVKKIILDIELTGGLYVQLIPQRNGKYYNPHHVRPERMRANADNSILYYKKAFAQKARRAEWEEAKPFPAFNRNKIQNCIFQFNEYRPGAGVYALPNYLQGLNYIKADAALSKATLTNAEGGFSASKMITFYGAEPAESVKKIIEEKIKGKYTGDQGDKVILSWVTKPEFAPTVEDLGTSDLTKEDFEQVDNLISGNIYAAHKVTNGALFGIPDKSHGLGGSAGAELRISYELFKNTYVAGKKQQAEKIINFLAALTGVTTKLELIDVEPVGYVFSESLIEKIAPRSWLLEKMAIDPLKYPDAPVGGLAPAVTPTAVAPVTQTETPGAPVNDALRNLTAKQNQHLLRTLRQYNKNQITREMAAILLRSSFGFSDDEINQILGTDETDKFGSDEDVAELFAAHGEPRSSYDTFERRKVETFADDKTYKDVEDKINAIRSKNPKATAASIAKELNIAEDVVAGYLDTVTDPVKIKLPRFKVMYSYEKRGDVDGPAVLPTTRPFCKKMLAMDKLYSREDIQKISAYLGYDVMKRAGGFWNNNGTVEYHCRHEFFSQIVVKKK